MRHSRAQALVDIIVETFKARLWRRVSSRCATSFDLPTDFFAVNVASQSAPASDDAVIQKLNALGLKCVRMNLNYEGSNQAEQALHSRTHAQRLLKRLLDEGFEVLLNILPPRKDAQKMAYSETAQKHWREHLNDLFSQYHSQYQQQLLRFEIGNTPNRKKWSGWGFRGFLSAWSIAAELAQTKEIELVGPNISDFEPFYNIAFLKAMHRIGHVPRTHSDNLFVERVIEPEAYDHRILGRLFTRFIKFNLIKKARTLDAIGRDLGCQSSLVSYTTWTLERLVRWSDQPEQKQADYLSRYLMLAASSGVLEKVYWGPLIDHRDGLIDDRNISPDIFKTREHWAAHALEYPTVDLVSHYATFHGELKYLRPRPAFFALKYLNAQLHGASCLQAISADNGISHFIFERASQEIHVCWCRDGGAIGVNEIYSNLSGAPEFYDVCGQRLNQPPASFNESPTFLIFDAGSGAGTATRPTPDALAHLPSLKQRNIHVTPKENWQHTPYENADWRGMVAFKQNVEFDHAIKAMLPESLLKSEVGKVMRDTRNKIWTTQTDTHGTVAIKLNRINRRKKIGYLFRDSKGRRHWNNASAMLRMGVNTPQPLAFFDRHQASGTSESYYVCAYLDQPFSARDVFTSLNKGEADFQSLAHDDLLKVIAEFICHMHNSGVLHRDLSPGNLLLQNKSGNVTASAIDIGRARTELTLSTRQRLIDLMRICYILSWPNREKLIQYYNQRLGRPVAHWWRLPVHYYVFKIESKKWLRSHIKHRTH